MEWIEKQEAEFKTAAWNVERFCRGQAVEPTRKSGRSWPRVMESVRRRIQYRARAEGKTLAEARHEAWRITEEWLDDIRKETEDGVCRAEDWTMNY